MKTAQISLSRHSTDSLHHVTKQFSDVVNRQNNVGGGEDCVY